MKEIKVTGCTDCPFCHVEWNPDSIGSDTYLSCNLIRHGRESYVNNGIGVYDSYDEKQDPIVTPEWCPLTEIQITKV